MRKKLNDTVKEVISDYNRRKEERKGLEAVWILNMNFLAGNQYAEILPTGKLAETVKRYHWQEYEVYNHIAPTIESRLAKFAGMRTDVSVRPATSDLADVNAAKFSTLLLKSVREEHDFKKLASEATFWSEVTGTSFYKVAWSDKKGAKIEEDLYEGDIDVSICPPFEIFPDYLSVQDVDYCQSIIHAKAYSQEEVAEIWGVTVKGSSTVLDVVGMGRTGVKAAPETKNGVVTVLEKYCRPTKEYPNGRLIIVAGDELVYNGELPFINKSEGKRGFPFVRQIALQRPNSFFGASIIERLIPIQRAYNALKNRKHEYFNRLAVGILMVEDGSVDLDDIQTEGLAPGKVIVYRQGSNIPIMMNMGDVPNDFRDEEDRLLNEFISVSGVSDFLTNSNVLSSGQISGVALNLIIEQDNGRLSLTSDSMREAVREVGRQVLRLYKQFASVNRLKRVSGENGEIEMRSFKGSDITSDDLAFDTENELINSAASRKATVKELLQMGLLNERDGGISDENRLKVIEMLGLGNWETARSDEELHVKKAVSENEKASVSTLDAAEFDNHNIHVSEHTRFLLSKECTLSDAKREELNAHIKTHRQYAKLIKEADALNS